MKLLFFDTETTGLPLDWKQPESNTDNWPRLVQLAYIVTDENDNTIVQGDFIIRPDGFSIPEQASNIHGITTDIAIERGMDLSEVLFGFLPLLNEADLVIGHNIVFDKKIVGSEFHRLSLPDSAIFLKEKETICTMMKSTKYCSLQGNYGNKWPKLQELHNILFGENFDSAHNAAADIQATRKCYFELKRLGVI